MTVARTPATNPITPAAISGGRDGHHRNVCPRCGKIVEHAPRWHVKSDTVALLIRVKRSSGTITFRSCGLYAHRACVAPIVADREDA